MAGMSQRGCHGLCVGRHLHAHLVKCLLHHSVSVVGRLSTSHQQPDLLCPSQPHFLHGVVGTLTAVEA